MVYVWPQCLLLSLFLIFFIINSSCARSTTRALLIHHDGHASRHDIRHEFYNGKGTSQANFGEQMGKVVNIAKGFKQESHATKEMTPINKEKTLETCFSRVKVSRISDQKVRKLLPRQRDMDEFVAYADYKGPMHHPPRNN